MNDDSMIADPSNGEEEAQVQKPVLAQEPEVNQELEVAAPEPSVEGNAEREEPITEEAQEVVQEQVQDTEEGQAVEVAPVSDQEVKKVSEVKGSKDAKGVKPALPAEFMEAYGQAETVANKLHVAISFMKEALNQTGRPQFKWFWESRRLCLPLFRENLNPVIRKALWAEYDELSREGRRLKEVFDEQTAFAVEQIDKAIEMLESDLASGGGGKRQEYVELQLPASCDSLRKNFGSYNRCQCELANLNTYASRINALRRELVATDMRVRHKNLFFKRLSSAGDQVFPKRKELIKEVSVLFSADIEEYVVRCKNSNQTDFRAIAALREEIKGLQSVAKTLTLNTRVFTQSRIDLSQCWDKIKGWEKERKKAWGEKKEAFKENLKQVEDKLEAFKATMAEGALSPEEVKKQLEEIDQFSRNLELGREERQTLKKAFDEVFGPIREKETQEANARKEKGAAAAKEKKEKLQAFHDRIVKLAEEADNVPVEQLVSEREVLMKEIQGVSFLEKEKRNLKHGLRRVEDAIDKQKERKLLSEAGEDQDSIDLLRNLLKEKKERRNEIKGRIEGYRKASGGSGLDFEAALRADELMVEEKVALEAVDQSVEEIRKKITDLKSKI